MKKPEISPASSELLQPLKTSNLENPTDPQRCYKLGKTMRETGDLEQAEKFLLIALHIQKEQDGTDLTNKIRHEMALLFLAKGKKIKSEDPEEALDCFQIAVEYDPDLIEAWRYITVLHLDSAIGGYHNIRRIEEKNKPAKKN